MGIVTYVTCNGFIGYWIFCTHAILYDIYRRCVHHVSQRDSVVRVVQICVYEDVSDELVKENHRSMERGAHLLFQ